MPGSVSGAGEPELDKRDGLLLTGSLVLGATAPRPADKQVPGSREHSGGAVEFSGFRYSPLMIKSRLLNLPREESESPTSSVPNVIKSV